MTNVDVVGIVVGTVVVVGAVVNVTHSQDSSG
jgi:hypothetical protein